MGITEGGGSPPNSCQEPACHAAVKHHFRSAKQHPHLPDSSLATAPDKSLRVPKTFCHQRPAPRRRLCAFFTYKEIAGQLKTVPEVKKFMKKVMPYVQMVKERYELIGERALDLTSPFDEHAILSESIDYIQATLESTFGLQGVQIKYAHDAGPGPILDNSYPGHPTYEFYRVPSVSMEAVNCQTCSGSFSVFLNVQADFTGLSTRQKIAKEQKVPIEKVTLFRYDTIASARSIPNMKEIMKGKVQIGDGEAFAIDTDKNVVTVNGQEVHDRLVYTVSA